MSFVSKTILKSWKNVLKDVLLIYDEKVFRKACLLISVCWKTWVWVLFEKIGCFQKWKISCFVGNLLRMKKKHLNMGPNNIDDLKHRPDFVEIFKFKNWWLWRMWTKTARQKWARQKKILDIVHVYLIEKMSPNLTKLLEAIDKEIDL